MGYLFWSGSDPANRRTDNSKRRDVENADRAFVAVFEQLQKVWRRQGTLRRTFNGMPTSREERESWKQLIQYLTDLPPPRN
jgi:hypothetical protein